MKRIRDLDVIGTSALEFFSQYRVDYAVFSCGGLSEAGKVLDYNADEMSARKAIAGCGKKSILVMDSRKNGLELPFQMGHAWDFDVIVTGASFSALVTDSCSRHGCQIVEV